MTATNDCGNCGAAFPAGSLFCPSCGERYVAATRPMAAHDTPTVRVDSVPVAVTAGVSAHVRIMEVLRQATLGEYEIVAELGRGGMATVYLAHDIALDRKVAIKVMSPALLEGEGAIERFKREARTAGGLSHPHIIPIHAVKESHELLYFVMKYVEGRSLDAVLEKQGGGLPIAMVVQILSEVGGALAYAHRKGVVHRDIKPANIMLDNEGWAVVTDFGIAKLVQKEGLTMTGTTVGTPAYMSPEQCAAREVTGRSDQYSLGIVAYELLTGHAPFTADSLMGMFLAQMDDTPAPLLEARPDCPPLLVKTVERMLAKAPEERWPGLDDVAAAIAPLKTAEQSTRVSMQALARVNDGRPRPSDFARPVSPTPLNVRRPRSAAAPADLRDAEAASRGRRWLWAAAAPVVIAGVWLAAKAGVPGSISSSPPAPARDIPAALSPVVQQQQQPATDSPGTSRQQDADTKVASRGDSAASASARRDPPSSTVQRPPVVPLNRSVDSSRPQVVIPSTTKARNEPAPAPPSTTPAGDPRRDSAASDPNAGAPSFTVISAGGSTTCGALANDAGVVCWGAASLTGSKLDGVLFEKLAVGDGHICGLTPAGEAFCWGANSQGQLGDGSTTDRSAPTAVRATQRFTEISVGAGHTCALTGDGTAFCWGGNKFGQLGDGSRSNRNRPVLVRSTAGNQGFNALAAGGSHTCGITKNNKAYCWGDGFSGQVGNAMQDFAQEPFAVKTGLSFRTVVAGDQHTCGLTTSGRVYCWGSNKQGQLGNETRDDRNVPDSVASDIVFRAIAAGGQHTCGIATTRALFCWGNNVDGRLGTGSRNSADVPAAAAKGETFSGVSAGSGHTCAITTGSRAMCWGGNTRGQLGGGSASPYSTVPVIVKLTGTR